MAFENRKYLEKRNEYPVEGSDSNFSFENHSREASKASEAKQAMRPSLSVNDARAVEAQEVPQARHPRRLQVRLQRDLLESKYSYVYSSFKTFTYFNDSLGERKILTRNLVFNLSVNEQEAREARPFVLPVLDDRLVRQKLFKSMGGKSPLREPRGSKKLVPYTVLEKILAKTAIK